MFISRLTKEQIDKFFGRATSFFINNTPHSDTYLYVSYDTDSMVLNHRMYDFEGSTISDEEEWRRYLYSIFGDEYYKAYSAYLKMQMEHKLGSLLQGDAADEDADE